MRTSLDTDVDEAGARDIIYYSDNLAVSIAAWVLEPGDSEEALRAIALLYGTTITRCMCLQCNPEP